MKEPPLEQSPQHGRCISSFLSSYLPAPYTASLNKFAYFYAMSSRHQKEQAAPSPSSLSLSLPLLSASPLKSSRLPESSSVQEAGRGQELLKGLDTHMDTSLTLPVLGRTKVGCLKLTGGPDSSFITGIPIRTIYFARNWKPDSN